MSEGENIEKLSVDPEQHFTQPPPRYNVQADPLSQLPNRANGIAVVPFLCATIKPPVSLEDEFVLPISSDL